MAKTSPCDKCGAAVIETTTENYKASHSMLLTLNVYVVLVSKWVLIFVKSRVKVNTAYYRRIILSQEILAAIKHGVN